MASVKTWLKAARLRTLPLALSSIILGTFLAAFEYEQVNWLVFVLCMATGLFLQVLSNFANDYGDSQKGTDNENRVGPARAIQSGEISVREMRQGMAVAGALALILGLILVFVGTAGIARWKTILFIVLGLACIAAAIKYTVGRNAYGYNGLGDLFVFLFFGLTGVVGAYYLQTQHLFFGAWLLGAVVGCFSVGVLNLNNMRDIVNDRNSGKVTVPVRIGFNASKLYHAALIYGGIALSLLFSLLYFQSWWMLLPYLSAIVFVKDVRSIMQIKEPRLLDPYLKRLSLSTLAFVVLYGVGLILCI